MFRIIISLVFSVFLVACGQAEAKGSSHPSSSDATAAILDADIVFPINFSHITYSADGYTLVCLKKKNGKYATCDNEDSDQTSVEVSSYLKSYFKAVPTIHIIGRTFMGVGSSSYMVFYLKRKPDND